MIFEIISGGEKTDWVGKEWAGLFFPRGKNWLGGNSGLLHRANGPALKKSPARGGGGGAGGLDPLWKITKI